MLSYAILCFLISFLGCIFIIWVSKRIKLFITDHIHNGPQKFHHIPTPRLGGLSLTIALFTALFLAFYRKEPYLKDFSLLIFSTLPVFLAGFFEDVSGKLSAKIRLLIISIGPFLAIFFLNASIKRVDLPIDPLFKISLFSYAFTVFAVVGISNAINIIDGFNGLASMVSIIILLALSYVSYKMGDYFLTTTCVCMIGALAGFFLLNYPNGLIFLGDGGAYLTGYIIGIISVLLVERHPQVSPWFPFMICIYPIFEVLFSIYRKAILRGISPFLPDGLHLHMLIYKRLTKKLLGAQADKLKRNYSTSPFLWLLCTLSVIPGLLWWDKTPYLIVSSIAFSFFYIYFYWKLLLKKKPFKWF